jgi:serine/threonine protein kinase/Tol biopolymer transport system component
MIGTRLAHYEITQHLGSGGMGDVYQATDLKLGRSIAIKMLPEAFARDAERIARFQREARVLAALNHPNIAGIHGMENTGGRPFLVLELVAGETLADRIGRGPLPVDEALGIATQIADALEAAHDAGVVHRDLKPANVKITPEGTVKVLDFGLAKGFAAESDSSNVANSPTISMAATQHGVILGTAAYMAPEQARGRNVDRRADIWAFGVILYEMVTGRRLFEGEDLTDTLAAVVRERPDLGAAPDALRPLLEKCLEKDPKKRLRHISGLHLLLERTAPAPAAVMQARGKSRFALAPWAVAAVALAALGTLAFMHFREIPLEPPATVFHVEPPPETAFVNPYGGFAPSPDGRYVVLTVRSQGSNQLWLRPMDSILARPLPGTEDGVFPTWSPDSNSVAFYAGGKLKRIEITGGGAITLADAVDTLVSATGTWSRDGVILFGSSQGLWRVSAAGGGAALLIKTEPAQKETGLGYPQFLPDGRRFLYFVAGTDPSVQGVYGSSLDDLSRRQLIVRTAAKGVYVPGRGTAPDYLLWMQEQTLRAQRFDPDALRLAGDPISVAEDIGLNPSNNMRAAFWASDSGLLIYFAAPTLRRRPVVWISREGKQLGVAAPEDTYSRIALAPDGQRLAVTKIDARNRDVWVREFARPVMPRLTYSADPDDIPVWSPDSTQIAFSSSRDDGVMQIYRKDASGAGQEERLTDGPNSKLALDWSRDGKYILYRELNPETGRDLMALPLDGDRKPIAVVKTQYNESTGAFSPDGKWVAYASNDSAPTQLYVQAFPGAAGAPAGRWQISTDGAYEVKWRGNELYYQTQDGRVMAAAVQASPQGIRAETPRDLFKAPFQAGGLHEFDVSADGQRFLLILNPNTEGNTDRLTVVLNWQATLLK